YDVSPLIDIGQIEDDGNLAGNGLKVEFLGRSYFVVLVRQDCCGRFGHFFNLELARWQIQFALVDADGLALDLDIELDFGAHRLLAEIEHASKDLQLARIIFVAGSIESYQGNIVHDHGPDGYLSGRRLAGDFEKLGGDR